MRNLITVFCLLFVLQANAQQVNYLNQGNASAKPTVFAPGIISDGLINRDFTISPKGNEIFFTIQHKDFISSTIMYIQLKNGKWGEVQVAPFSGMYNDLEAQFSPDGKKIFFSSNRKVDATDTLNDYDMWYVEKTVSGVWGKPVHLGFTVNSPHDEFYPSITRSGNLYFTAQLDYGVGKEDIFMCEWKNGHYQSPVPVSTTVNSKGYEFNAFVDPDEQFILFTGYGRKDDMGKGDLYISKKNEKGEWQEAKNFGALVNSKGLDYCPFVSWDKRTLFFSSNRNINGGPFDKPVTASTIKKNLSGPGNGLDDIYWIKFDELLKQF
jgi:hypothetical protein